MKIEAYGYQASAQDDVNPQPLELSEVTLVLDAETALRIAAFFEACATGMTESGTGWDHRHLQDVEPAWSGPADLIVAQAARNKA